MPTLAQLQAEPYWGREIVTPELDWLGDTLCARTGRPRAAFGSKGDEAHLRGGHRSQEWIKNSRYCTNRTYTAQSGLTVEQARHIAAGDFTPGPWGTPENRRLMVVQTSRLVAAAKAGRLDGIREIIGTLDGRTVYGYRVTTGATFTADDSHLDHWHGTFDRRRMRDKALMERILTAVLGQEDDMQLTDPLKGYPGKTVDNSLADPLLTLHHLWSQADGSGTQPPIQFLPTSRLGRLLAVPDRLTALEQKVAALQVPAPTPVDVPALARELLPLLAAEIRDAVADLGEGGAAQVRSDNT